MGCDTLLVQYRGTIFDGSDERVNDIAFADTKPLLLSVNEKRHPRAFGTPRRSSRLRLCE